ncbi:MAG: helix-turn-helix transcriptional regulator [Actinomycetota bacterium]|nr:helix-turn-helix transcriptional regulator [Actinomycetota bacterium]
MRRTHNLIQILNAILDTDGDRVWGYDLQKRAAVRSGALYPVLRRLHEQGWLEDGWEDPAEIAEARPPRRYYTVTPDGHARIRELLADAAADRRFAGILKRETS